MLSENPLFHRFIKEPSLKQEASKRLIKPTKRVVETAMSLIKRGAVDDEGAQTVFVIDSKTMHFYRLSDYDIRDHEQESDQPHDYPGLNSGLLIEVLSEEGLEIDGINLPRLPERVTVENLYPIQGFTPHIMRALAKSLERAEIIASPSSNTELIE